VSDLNVFLFVVQLFAKVPSLKPIALRRASL
jgi:hypothetical protein